MVGPTLYKNTRMLKARHFSLEFSNDLALDFSS